MGHEEKQVSSTPERRRVPRVECCFPVQCHTGGSQFGGNVVNIGLGGMRLLTSEPLTPMDLIGITQNGLGGEVNVQVVWTHNDEAGVIYRGSVDQLERSWVKVALMQLGFEKDALYERRIHTRKTVTVACELRSAEKTVSCTLVNLCLGGALVQLSEPAALGEGTMQLSVPFDGVDPLPVEVVYRHDDKVGLKFSPQSFIRQQARLLEGYLHSLH